MRVALFTTGITDVKKTKNLVRKYIPGIVRHIKTASLLLPPDVQRPLLSGFSRERRFPTGLGLLSSMLKAAGHEVFLIDRFVDPDDWIDDVRKVDFVGVHTTTPCFDDAIAIVDRLEQEKYTGPIALGGPHVALYPETVPPRVDFVVQGEGEYIIKDLVEGVYPRGSMIQSQRVDDLDQLPMTDYELFFDKPRNYELVTPFFSEQPVFNLSTSRSCPYKCTFCATRRIWGLLWRTLSPERIVNEIMYLKKTYQIAGIYFREDLFTTNKKRVMEVCELMLQHKINLPWACETRAQEACDTDMVELMARAGCRGFYIGAESGSQRMLDLYNKEATVEDTITACAVAKRNNIKIAMSIIVADPASKLRDRIDTWKMVRQCNPEILQSSVYDGAHTAEGNKSQYPTYPAREVINVESSNGTWKGQNDRLSRDLPSLRSQTQVHPTLQNSVI